VLTTRAVLCRDDLVLCCVMMGCVVPCCAQTSIKIWDLESKSVVDDLRPEFSKTYGRKAIEPYCVSLAWSADGGTLFAGGRGCGGCCGVGYVVCSQCPDESSHSQSWRSATTRTAEPSFAAVFVILETPCPVLDTIISCFFRAAP
jgi:hypothetical protein